MNSFIFWIHLVLSPFFGWVQCQKMLHSTQGVSVSMFVTSFVFVFIQTWLSWSAYRKDANRINLQVVVIYITGILNYGCLVVVPFFSESSYVWNSADSVAISLALIGATIAICIGKKYKLPWHDPIVKGGINVAMRVVPNFFMAYAILKNGGAGVSGIFVGVFNLLTILRIIQIILTSHRLGSWDRNRVGLIIGETANETSWLVVTIVWCCSYS